MALSTIAASWNASAHHRPAEQPHLVVGAEVAREQLVEQRTHRRDDAMGVVVVNPRLERADDAGRGGVRPEEPPTHGLLRERDRLARGGAARRH